MNEVIMCFMCDHCLSAAIMCLFAFRNRVMRFIETSANVLRETFVSLYGILYILCGGVIASAFFASYMEKAAFAEFITTQFNPLIGALIFELSFLLIYMFDFLVNKNLSANKKIELYATDVEEQSAVVSEFVRLPELVLLQ